MVTVDWLVDPLESVIADGLSVTANPSYNDPDSVTVPAKPARLFRPILAVPVEPGDMANVVMLVLSRKSGPVAGFWDAGVGGIRCRVAAAGPGGVAGGREGDNRGRQGGGVFLVGGGGGGPGGA